MATTPFYHSSGKREARLSVSKGRAGGCVVVVSLKKGLELLEWEGSMHYAGVVCWMAHLPADGAGVAGCSFFCTVDLKGNFQEQRVYRGLARV